MILQIRAAPTDTLRWCKEELWHAWKHIFPITPTSVRTGNLPLDHPTWGQTPNPWWKFLTDTPLLLWEEAEELSNQRRPSIMPHFNESRWIIQERIPVDFRAMAAAYMGNHPMLKLVQILAPIKRCDVLNFLIALFEEEKAWIGRDVVEERKGLWALKPFKALELDGLHVGVFPACLA
ncbi:hypothetical protein SO802_002662 [Lithocarpus litseifolius]|uniref:Uncharacterized protein n=1 Tax=Lithocarpus litseifolius TaxID=425828 RepID=A0AAW2E1K9_9ROSI